MSSRLNRWTEDQLRKAVASSTTFRGVLISLGLQPSGGNYTTLYKAIIDLGLDVCPFTRKKDTRKGKRNNSRIPLAEVMVKGSTYKTNHLRKRLIRAGLLEKQCSRCKGVEWQGVPIPLELDHINGVNDDHRMENLRLLCPNCHSLTDTYAGRNILRSSSHICKDCRCVLQKGKVRCAKCRDRIKVERKDRAKLQRKECGGRGRPKIKWPSDEELASILWKTPATKVSVLLGVSGSAISKHCKVRGIRKPSRGYWSSSSCRADKLVEQKSKLSE